jgi:hypothetical protein
MLTHGTAHPFDVFDRQAQSRVPWRKYLPMLDREELPLGCYAGPSRVGRRTLFGVINNRLFIPGALRLAGTAAAGVLAGHFLGYRIVFPGSPQRHGILIETGHGYFPVALRFAAMIAVIVGAATLARGYARAKDGGRALPTVGITASRLAVLQLSAFVGLEFFERLVSGVPFHHFLLPVLLVGAIAQIAIAAVGAALIHALYRVGERAARTTVPGCAAAQPKLWVPERVPFASNRSLDAPRPIRGPPSLFLYHAA